MSYSEPPTTATEPRTNHAHRTPSSIFFNPPEDAAGRQFDVSDRLLICSSNNMRSEVVVGGSDHALYSIDVNDPRKKHTTMYKKQYGHTDWVTSCAHMCDGRVLSGGMDGKLCLWQQNRVVCTDLLHSTMHPISKVVSDLRYNLATTCTYDGNMLVWKFGDEMLSEDEVSSSIGNDPSVSGSRGGRVSAATLNRRAGLSGGAGGGARGAAARAGAAAGASTTPLLHLHGHADPVLECTYVGNNMVSGDKGGAILVWDLGRGGGAELLCHRFRAHPGPVTSLECIEDGNVFISTGTDGYVKIWDPRSSGSGLVQKIPAHVYSAGGGVDGNSRRVDGARGGRAAGRSSGRGGRSDRSSSGRTSSSTAAGISAPPPSAFPVACMSTMRNLRRGSSPDINYIVTASGAAQDSSLALIDPRMHSPQQASSAIVARLSHHRNGVYSMCVVGDACVFSGDGVGTMLCYNMLLASESDGDVGGGAFSGGSMGVGATSASGDGCLQYGIGASQQGAVRTIDCVNGKIVAGGEDGNVLIFDYANVPHTEVYYK